MLQKKKRSIVAVSITLLYLIALLASLVIMLMTAEETAMSGIFLVMVTMPWTMLLGWLKELLQTDSMLLSTVFLISGGLVNSFVLYKMLSFVTGGYKK